MNIITVIGARPQFIKAAPVSKALENMKINEYILHTGQHYDEKMSYVFFRELALKRPKWNLQVGSGSHGWQTGQMLIGIEEIISNQKPDYILVYGDTNSTLAGALAGCKYGVKIVHVEAGLRSFNREMPEEYNRILTDHCSDILFCPTKTAINNLKNEGIKDNVHLVGDTMFDCIVQFKDKAMRQTSMNEKLGINKHEFILATLHRPSNVDNPINLRSIVSALIEIEEDVIFPIHPRTRKLINQLGADIVQKLKNSKVIIINPIGLIDMISLESNARIIVTDSGGIQKEAYILGVQCLTLRNETEWIETLEDGWNTLVGNDKESIIQNIKHPWFPTQQKNLFGDGKASQRIAQFFSCA